MLSVWTKTAWWAPKWKWSCIVAVAALAGPATAAATAVTSAAAPRTAVTFAPATPKRAGNLIRSPRLSTWHALFSPRRSPRVTDNHHVHRPLSCALRTARQLQGKRPPPDHLDVLNI